MIFKIRVPKIHNELHIGLLLMIIKVSFSASRILPYSNLTDNVLSIVAAGLLVVHILKEKYSLKRLIVYGVITLLSTYTSYVTGQNGFLITVITIFAIAAEDIDKVVLFIYKFEFAFLFIHTVYAIASHTFFSTPISTVVYGTLRYDFGFQHPNMFSIYLFNLFLMWIWLNYERITTKNIIIIFAIGLVSYFFTKTRTSFLDTIIIILILLARKKDKSLVLAVSTMFVVPILSTVFWIFINEYAKGNTFIFLFDRLFSSRIRLGAYAYEHNGFSFFGQDLRRMNVVWDSFWRLNGHTFDCIYTYLIVENGLVWLLIISVCFFLLAKRANNRINIQLLAWCLYGITEVHGLNGYKCFPILLIAFLADFKGIRNREQE